MLSIVTTKDGSPTIKNDLTGDTYHSIHGAIQESQHVFIKHGLEYVIQTFAKEEINVLEVGLGTGLNALLTLQFAINSNSKINYVAIEAFPLEKNIYHQLNYGMDSDSLQQFHECEWGKAIQFSPTFSFTKHQSKIENIELPVTSFDLVYYDAFAPNSQPEMWTPDIFNKLKSSMARPSILTTYCSKGEVRRTLKSVGFNVEKLPGPPGKREMLRASLV